MDGTGVRDYVHVYDIARAHLTAAERMVAGESFCEPINLGSGKGYSVLEVIKALSEVSGQVIQYKIGERRLGDPASLVASNALAHKKLGWKPEKNLEQIIQDALVWQRAKRY